MPRINFRSIVLALSLLLAFRIHAQEAVPATSTITWQETASLAGLTSTDIAKLDKDNILISNQAYKQVFEAYQTGAQPLFITSDSLLNAYHVLYEESILQLENTHSFQLPEILRLILRNLKNVDEHIEEKDSSVIVAKKRATLIISIAIRLIDQGFRTESENLNTIIETEVERIEKADGTSMPDWLAKPDPFFIGLDYTRFKPRGFYTRSVRLQNYFRAISWLQAIPFRVNNDTELWTILMLGNSIEREHTNTSIDKYKARDFFNSFSLLIGSQDNWDLAKAAQYAQNNLERWNFDFSRDNGQKSPSEINDQLTAQSPNNENSSEPHYRIISPYITPSSQLFQITSRIRNATPSSLEVASCLGSSFASKHLERNDNEALMKAIDDNRSLFSDGDSLYHLYLDALKALVDNAEPDAPAFMNSTAWKTKSCNTVLAGWAQMRHTWTLQAKQSVFYLGMTMVPNGFVEPEPDFYARMAELASETKYELSAIDDKTEQRLRLIENLQKIRNAFESAKNKQGITSIRDQVTFQEFLLLEAVFEDLNDPINIYSSHSEQLLKKLNTGIDKTLLDIKMGKMTDYSKLLESFANNPINLQSLWSQLENVCRKLESIAHKQLRGRAFNETENSFIKTYGETIAGLMLYDGNSYLTPNDDAPRVVDVHSNPQQGTFLNVGIARARKLYILYPWKGKTILCKGAVLPFYSFEDSNRMTDQTWRKRLDSKQRPKVPDWLSPIVQTGELETPVLINGH